MGYPLLNMTDIFDQVGDACYDTLMDCAFGSHQIALEEDDAHVTAFPIPSGHFAYVKMPFQTTECSARVSKSNEYHIGQNMHLYTSIMLLLIQKLLKKTTNYLMES